MAIADGDDNSYREFAETWSEFSSQLAKIIIAIRSSGIQNQNPSRDLDVCIISLGSIDWTECLKQSSPKYCYLQFVFYVEFEQNVKVVSRSDCLL